MVEVENLKESILLDTRDHAHVALSIRGSGILTKALIGRLGGYEEAQRTAIDFAYRVVRAIGLSFADGERLPTPQILVDAADAVITDPLASLTCTTWKWLAEGIEVCSIGANTVLLFQENTIRQLIAPHTVYELLKSQGGPLPSLHLGSAHVPLKALGLKKHSQIGTVEDIRVAVVPLYPTSTLAVIEEPCLAEEIVEQQVPRQDLASFIESWDGLAKKLRTSVLISF
jgi:hypothetical protein